MEPWLPFALGALIVWSVQRVVTKVALVRWSTAYFYRLNAFLSLLVYVPFAVLYPPDLTAGRWLLHCHINHHTTYDNHEERGAGGLTLILEVG